MTFYVKQNDTSPSMLAELKDAEGNAVNLGGASVNFHMKPMGSRDVSISAAASVVSESRGVVRYDWQEGDTADVGAFQAEFQVTFADGSVETFPNDSYIRVQITAEID